MQSIWFFKNLKKFRDFYHLKLAETLGLLLQAHCATSPHSPSLFEDVLVTIHPVVLIR